MKEQEAIRILKVNATISASQTTFCEAVQVAAAALEEIQKYRALGTVEECMKAVGKQTPKKPVAYASTNRADCFICGATVRGIKDPFGNYCSKCGHAIDWGKEPYIGDQHENT